MAELKTITCIDDDPDILSIVKLCLEKVGGYKVFTCTNGVEALSRMAEIAPDLILLDVMIPGMDGPAIIKEFRKRAIFRSIPVIFMTARVQPNEVQEYLSYGAAAVIAKPFDPMTLSAQVQEIWKKTMPGNK